MIQRAVIAGGKTGGHLYPGIAVAEEILARNPEANVTFIGTSEGLEARVLPRLGYTLRTITVSRLKGAGLLGRILGLMRVPVAVLQTLRMLFKLRPQVVLGVGGYASGPALLAAWIARYPTAIQEQNATPGLTNRILGRVVQAIYLGFGAAADHFDAAKTLETGNPIRRSLCEQLERAADEAGEDDGNGRFSILVFGGSQGARFLNEHVPAAVAAFCEARGTLEVAVTHQTGQTDQEVTEGRYQALGLGDLVDVVPYIDDMPGAYGASDVAICRAGALTVAEVTAVGLPCLLVPFPFAADNHQEANARVLVEAGAGHLVVQSAWEAGEVSEWLTHVATDREARRQMADNARGLARPGATGAVVDHLEGLAA